MFKKIILLSVSFVLSFCFTGLAVAMPGGNYTETCHKCSWSNKHRFLRCKCKDTDGNIKKTSLYVRDCKTVENDNGNLVCTQHFNHPDHHHNHHPSHYHEKQFVNAGPIWSQPDAEQVCPGVCQNKMGRKWKWTGQWRTVVAGEKSVCECKKK